MATKRDKKLKKFSPRSREGGRYDRLILKTPKRGREKGMREEDDAQGGDLVTAKKGGGQKKSWGCGCPELRPAGEEKMTGEDSRD